MESAVNTMNYYNYSAMEIFMKKVIITGADGFIGSHLTRYLVTKGIEIWAIVYPQSTTKEKIRNLDHVHIIESRIEELESHIDEFPKNANAFFHFAWQGVDALQRNDFNLQLENIELCTKCMKLAADLRTEKFIFPGSTYEYMYCGQPINEYAVPTPRNAYGSVKAALRYIAAEYAKQLKLNYIYVVIAGIYAADRRDNNVIFYVIDKLLKREKPKVTKLEQLWDYVHIDDVVEALFLIGDKGKNNAFYTVGRGDNQPLYRYIEIIHNYIDSTLPIGIGEIEYDNDKLPASCVDLTAIKNDVGFVPKVGFKEGIKRVIDTMRIEEQYIKNKSEGEK